jgi:Uma2 family endonuclease
MRLRAPPRQANQFTIGCISQSVYDRSMNQLALDPAYRRVTVEEFLRMDLGDGKAELVDGIISMMAGALNAHNAIQMNVSVALANRLRGSGCRPYGPDQAVRTGASSIRFPDVSVYCNDPASPERDREQLLGDPKVIVEVLSDSTRENDQRFKLLEYQALPGVEAILFLDPATQQVRLVARTGPGGWTDNWLDPGSDVPLTCLGITLPHSELFARD